VGGQAPSVHIRERVARHGAEFDDFTLRIAKGNRSEYASLMRSPIREYTMAAEHYLEQVVAANNAAERAKNKPRR